VGAPDVVGALYRRNCDLYLPLCPPMRFPVLSALALNGALRCPTVRLTDRSREDVVKYLVISNVRLSGTPAEMDAESDRIAALRQQWTPSDRTVEAFVMALNGQTTWMIVETDDHEGLMKDLATWTPIVDQQVIPVVPIEVGGRVLAESREVRRNALG
jgi:hypothetical protein